MDESDPDFELRHAAMERVRGLARHYDDLIPLAALKEGFLVHGERISFGSFYSGIFRPRQMQGTAALAIVTAPPKPDREAPYDDGYDSATGTFTYRYRDPVSATPAAARAAAADNRALSAAFQAGAPLIYFRGIAPAQYAAVAPVFVTRDDSERRLVHLEVALPVADTTPRGLVSPPDVRRYATAEARYRLHQQRFRFEVMRAYQSRCAVCALREAALVQAAHIIEDREDRGHPTVVNGIALCAIHHLAYDRNLMGIDPKGVVHIAHRLLHEHDGPMLRSGLQGFHQARILQPRRIIERPDPDRLEQRFQGFRENAA